MKFLRNPIYFKVAFLVYMFMNTLALGYVGINKFYLSIPMILWGTIVIISELWMKKRILRPHWMLIYGCILCFSTIRNSYSNLTSYSMLWIQMIIFILIFYPNQKRTKKEIEMELQMIIPLLNVLVGLSGAISIAMYWNHFTSVRNGCRIGMVGSRLFGIYFNCNPAAFLSCITILMAVYAISKKYKWRIFYLLNIVIQVCYVVLSQCRASLLILIFIISSLLTYFIIRKKQQNIRKCWITFFIILVGTVFASILLEQGIVWLQKVAGIPIQHTNRFQMEKIIEAIQLLLSGGADNMAKAKELLNKISSGRIDLIETSIQVWRKYSIFGVGVNNFQRIGSAITDGVTIQSPQVVHTHNIFLEALVTTGLIGFVIWMLFVVQAVNQMIQSIKKSIKQREILYLLAVLIVISEWIGGCFDYGVFYNYSLSATLSWLFLGYLYQLREKK